MLVHQYELFKMHEHETKSEIHERFMKIINSLISFGKTYNEKEMCLKVLRTLPRSWMSKVTSIQEAKDMSTLLLDDMIGSLLRHEISLENLKLEEEKKLSKTSKRGIVLKYQVTKVGQKWIWKTTQHSLQSK